MFVPQFACFKRLPPLSSLTIVMCAFCMISFILAYRRVQHDNGIKLRSADDLDHTPSPLAAHPDGDESVEYTPKYTIDATETAPDGAVTEPKTILLWNRFFYSMDYGVGFGTKPFHDVNCPRTCNIVTDRALLETADAVIVHMFYLPKDVPGASLPIRAHDKQIFVFYNLENPVRNYRGLVTLDYKDVFNLTFTYLNDSQTDVYSPYGDIRRRKRPALKAVPSQFILQGKKTRDVVWLVSNCLAPSSRYEYVRELSRHIKVDIYGKCGRDICPKGNTCLEWLDQDYKFYLAFENGFCKDYITEKAFKILDTNMIPIVHGGANYTNVLPPHSFINVRDYESPNHLAKYLAYLSNNPDKFLEYFNWKTDFEVLPVGYCKLQSFCKLCRILHDESYTYKRGFDPVEYWSPQVCLQKDEERQAVRLI